MSSEIRETDRIKPLIEYIKRNLEKGYKLEDLKWALVNQGNSRVAIEKAIKYVTEFQEAQKPKKPEPVTEIIEPEIHVEEKQGFWSRLKNKFKKNSI